MLAVQSVNVRDNFMEWCDKISMGETVVISRPQNENIYMINEAEYNALQKAKRNAEYLAMLDESEAQLKRGETITLTLDELKEMESDNWNPADKIVEFEKQHNIQRQGIGKPELLKHNKSGLYSRRIDDTNRLVYEISENHIIIKSCKGHYED